MTHYEIFETPFSAGAIIDDKAYTEISLVEHITCLISNLQHDLSKPSNVLGVDYWGERILAYTKALQEVRDIKRRKDEENERRGQEALTDSLLRK